MVETGIIVFESRLYVITSRVNACLARAFFIEEKLGGGITKVTFLLPSQWPEVRSSALPKIYFDVVEIIDSAG